MTTTADAITEQPSIEPQAGALSSRRVHMLAALSLFVVLVLYQDSLPLGESPKSPFHNVNSTDEMHAVGELAPTSAGTPKNPLMPNDTRNTTGHTCTAYLNSDQCSSTMGQQIVEPRSELVTNLPLNPRAHVFSFPHNVRNKEGQRPFLCVPQKNGNKQFGGLVYAAWQKKPPKSGEQVDHDMKHWEQRKIKSHDKHSHVYFIARDPYSRILSMYLQKVVNACISDGQKGCETHGWHGIHAETSFKDYVKAIVHRREKWGSLCGISHHLCQQVESCLTTTLEADNVTVLRLEEQSCWFPCLANQTGFESSLLEHRWTKFSGRSCYFSATGDCKDMLTSIDPTKVGVATGNVHATGASNKLNEHYDRETAETVATLYKDDFRVLGYPLWDGESIRSIT